MNIRAFRLLIFLLFIIASGCASVVTPTGGKKDVRGPRLLSITPKDSLLNTHVTKIELRFDEYITVADVTKELQVSPILPIQPTLTGANKKATLKLIDSLLEPNTTYRISFGNAIKDLHEGNPFKNYTYTFSTGPYFDSMEIRGRVINAATGRPDSGMVVILYNAAESDSAVVRKKPKYIGRVAGDGSFAVKGLPDKPFHIYALKDANDNLIYDGGDEQIAFLDHNVRAGDTAMAPILLRTFREIDTSRKVVSDTTTNRPRGRLSKSKEGFGYNVDLDTSDSRKRTFDITKPVVVTFNKPIGAIAASRVSLSFDSSGVSYPSADSVTILDTGTIHTVVRIYAPWLDNTIYTLKLLKGFAKDTSGADAMPSRYTFRTKRDEDYGKLQVNLPSKYYGSKFLFLVIAEKDTVYQKPVHDTSVVLTKLRPGMYTFYIIKDDNGNGKWDPGSLFLKIQPEEVIPYESVLKVKAGWDNIIDFEAKKKRLSDKADVKPPTTLPHK